jgi:hypothetical protein
MTLFPHVKVHFPNGHLIELSYIARILYMWKKVCVYKNIFVEEKKVNSREEKTFYFYFFATELNYLTFFVPELTHSQVLLSDSFTNYCFSEAQTTIIKEEMSAFRVTFWTHIGGANVVSVCDILEKFQFSSSYYCYYFHSCAKIMSDFRKQHTHTRIQACIFVMCDCCCCCCSSEVLRMKIFGVPISVLKS